MTPRLMLLALPLSLLFACTDKGEGSDEDGGSDGSDEAVDADGDGFAEDVDCDDNDEAINPSADELCDGIDNNCDGNVDGDDSTDAGTWFLDSDGDGYGTDPVTACEQPEATAELDGDCNDDDDAIHPGAVEVCDDADVDEDCSGAADDADAGVDSSTQTLVFIDGDSDGYGDETDAGTLYCDPPSGTVTDNTDCNDGVTEINPGATEVCDAADVDEDCNGVADDADSGVDISTQTTVYPDSDMDGYGDEDDAGTLYCDPPSGTVTDNTDCNDGAAHQHPTALELCNGEDDDCDGSSDDSGVATFWDTAGSATDYSATLAGTPTVPAAVALSTAGDLAICDGTWYTNLTISASVNVYGQSGVAGDVVLDGAETDPLVQMYTDTIDVALTDLTLQHGQGSDALTGGTGDTTGGGIVCYSGAADVTLALDNVVIDSNIAAYTGGGLFIYDCDVTLTSSAVIGNSAEFGGGIFNGGGALVITDSAVDNNIATDDIGGIYLFEWSGTGTSMTMTDSSISGNEAADVGSGLAVEDSVATVTGTTAGAMVITDNTEGGNWGAVQVEGAGEVTFTNVDFGTPAGGDDNDPYDVYLDANGFHYWYDDGESFYCDAALCGAETTETLGFTDSTADNPAVIRGNSFKADAQGTIGRFAFELNVLYGYGCDVDLFVVSAATTSTTRWTIEWIESVSVTSTTAAWVETSDIGLPVEVGTHYAVGFATDCSSSWDELVYSYDFSGSSTSDVGMGTSNGRLLSLTYPGFGSAGTTGDPGYRSDSTRYYGTLDWSH